MVNHVDSPSTSRLPRPSVPYDCSSGEVREWLVVKRDAMRRVSRLRDRLRAILLFSFTNVHFQVQTVEHGEDGVVPLPTLKCPRWQFYITILYK
jgi:hypothetical protein